MSRFRHRLLSELEAWLDDGLIEPRQADAIRERYPQGEDVLWGRMVLSVFGAIVFGLGIILFFAYNWADMPKVAKLGVVFSGLIGAHAAGYVLNLRQRASKPVIEAFHLLGTMLFGAGIWLISQIYHFDQIFPDPLLIWGLGALAIAWALPSLPQAFVSLFLIVAWSLSPERIFLPESNFLASPLLVVGVLPLAWRLRSGALSFFVAASLLAVLPFGVAEQADNMVVFLVFFMAATYFGSGLLFKNRQWPAALGLGPVSVLGQCVYFPMLLLASFKDSIRTLTGAMPESVFQWSVFLVSLGAAIAVFAATWPKLDSGQRTEKATVIVAISALAYSAIVPFELLNLSPLTIALPFSVFLLAHGVILILEGSHRQSWAQVASGCLVIATLTLIRFTDLFESLLSRSLAFLLLGAGLFAVGHYYQANKQQTEAEHVQHR